MSTSELEIDRRIESIKIKIKNDSVKMKNTYCMKQPFVKLSSDFNGKFKNINNIDDRRSALESMLIKCYKYENAQNIIQMCDSDKNARSSFQLIGIIEYMKPIKKRFNNLKEAYEMFEDEIENFDIEIKIIEKRANESNERKRSASNNEAFKTINESKETSKRATIRKNEIKIEIIELEKYFNEFKGDFDSKKKQIIKLNKQIEKFIEDIQWHLVELDQLCDFGLREYDMDDVTFYSGMVNDYCSRYNFEKYFNLK